jgi:hypothetical protein
MRCPQIILVSSLLIVATACSSTRVHSDHDHEADFSSYSTWAWYTSDDAQKRPTAGTSNIVDGRIRRAMQENLIAKGYEPASAESADLLVTYYASLSSQLRMYSTYWGYGWGGYWPYGYSYWPGWGTTTVYPYHEGTIIVDIVDRRIDQLVWRGVITRALKKKSSSEEQISEAMHRVMEGFPPA